ncbi:MAG: glycosyltransferase [Alphaproteobacteria bacterium]|nr:glycosyltransferase [Alphaproteobacteria bacterium]
MSEATRTTAEPRVSIVMAAHNAEPFIRTAIDSALAQTEASLELIVVDDGSSDGTCAVVDRYCRRDPRVRLIRNVVRRGPGHARNRAVDAARGQWIAVLDADDWMSADRLSALLAHAQRSRAALVADNQQFVRGENSRPHRQLFRAAKRAPDVLTALDLLRNDRIGRTGNFGLLKPVVRRRVLVENRIRYDETLKNGEDFYFLLDCLRCVGGLLLVGESHYFYRIHKASISSAPSIETLKSVLKVQRRYSGLFDPVKDAPTLGLMRKRTRDLERYIRCKGLIVPLKRGDLSRALRQTIDDPAILVFLIQPLGRFLERYASMYWSEYHPLRRLGLERRRDRELAQEATGNVGLG